MRAAGRGPLALPHRPVSVANASRSDDDDAGLLAAPDLAPHVVRAAGAGSLVATASVRGWRSTMEDFTAVHAAGDTLYVGVFDGHNGKACAEHCAGEEGIYATLKDARLPSMRPSEAIPLLQQGYEAVDADFVLGEPDDSCVGCTGASLWLQGDGALLCAWAGDTMVYLVRQGAPVPLTCEHAPTPADVARVKQAGGMVTADGYIKWSSEPEQIRVSRCFGNKMLKSQAEAVAESLVLPEPDHTTVRLGVHDQCVFVCSRSLLACVTPEYIAEYIARCVDSDGGDTLPQALHDLLAGAVARDCSQRARADNPAGYDNMSIAAIIPARHVTPKAGAARARTWAAAAEGTPPAGQLSEVGTTHRWLLDWWRAQGVTPAERTASNSTAERQASLDQRTATDDEDDLVADLIVLEDEAPAAGADVTTAPVTADAAATSSPPLQQHYVHITPLDADTRQVDSEVRAVSADTNCVYSGGGSDAPDPTRQSGSLRLRDGGVAQIRSQMRLTAQTTTLPFAILGLAFLVWAVYHLRHGECVLCALMGVGSLVLLARVVVSSQAAVPNFVAEEAVLVFLSLGVLLPYDLLCGPGIGVWALYVVVFSLFALVPTRTPVALGVGALVIAWVVCRTVDESTEAFGFEGAALRERRWELNQRVRGSSEWLAMTLLTRVSALALVLLVAWAVKDVEGEVAKRLEALVQVVGGVLSIMLHDDNAPDLADVVGLAHLVHPTPILAEAVETLVGTAPAQEVSSLPAALSMLNLLENLRTRAPPPGSINPLAPQGASPATVAGGEDVLESGDMEPLAAVKAAGYRRQECTVACVALTQQWVVKKYATFHALVTTACDESAGELLTFGGNTATVVWNLRDGGHNNAEDRHCKQAMVFVTALQQLNTAPQMLAMNIAISSGVVQVREDDKAMGEVVVGKPITLSSLLVSYARDVKCRVVITEKVFEANKGTIHARPVDVVSLGGDRAQVVYEVRSTRSGTQLQTDANYELAFAALRKLRLQTAREEFKRVLDAEPMDTQAKRLLLTAMWLQQTDMQYCHGAAEYSRRLTSELEAYSARFVTGDVLAMSSSVDRLNGTTPTPAAKGAADTPSRPKRQSLKHDQILRRQIRDAEAEANSEQLVAWGLPGARSTLSVGIDGQRLKTLPTRFNDHKNNLWCRGTRSLGRGAFGEVWLGMAANGSLVAMKSMKLPTFTANSAGADAIPPAARRRLERKQAASPMANGRSPEHIDQLLREVSLMHTLRHENIVSYMASTIVDGYVMIVMEYLSGGSLNDMLSNFSLGTILPSSIQRYVRDIVSGLRFLHSRDMIHRDMKPHNVLLLVDGQCKLADFGASAGLSQLAKSNQGVIGTPLYMSPEACVGKACKASDIWAVGIIVCQLFTGVVPYPGFLDTSLFSPHTFLFQLGKRHLLPQVPHAMPPCARSLAQRCLLQTPDERPTAAELLELVIGWDVMGP